MKELTYQPVGDKAIPEDMQEDSFLDDVFGLGETTELCKYRPAYFL